MSITTESVCFAFKINSSNISWIQNVFKVFIKQYVFYPSQNPLQTARTMTTAQILFNISCGPRAKKLRGVANHVSSLRNGRLETINSSYDPINTICCRTVYTRETRGGVATSNPTINIKYFKFYRHLHVYLLILKIILYIKYYCS